MIVQMCLFSANISRWKRWRKALFKSLEKIKIFVKLINNYNDIELHDLMTNLAGHDITSLEKSFIKYGLMMTADMFYMLHCKRFWFAFSGT